MINYEDTESYDYTVMVLVCDPVFCSDLMFKFFLVIFINQ